MAQPAQTSPTARGTGLIYLLYFATAIPGLVLMRELVAPNDAAATVHAILTHEVLYRLGTAFDIASHRREGVSRILFRSNEMRVEMKLPPRNGCPGVSGTRARDRAPALAFLAASTPPLTPTGVVGKGRQTLKSLHEEDDVDGFVSLEVSPFLALDAEGTAKQAKELWAKVDRKNVMIKIPGTEPGLKAIRESIGHGISINVTLLFGLQRYEEVTEAYIAGLEDHLAAGHSIAHIRSVASFFLSRIDVAVSFDREGGIIVRVNDDGAAKTEEDASRSDQGGFGLIGMRERVAATGGTLSIDRDNPAGWTVSARLPVGEAVAPQEAAE